MEIRRIVSDLIISNMYVVSEKGHAVIIDPCRNTDVFEKYVIDRILLTHEHYDHISGVNLFREKTTAPILCSSRCAENMGKPKNNLSAFFKSFCELQTWIRLESIPEEDTEYSCFADETFLDKTSFEWMGHHFELFGLSGHSSGSIGIVLDQQAFFSGDSLFENEKTAVHLPGGSRKERERVSKPRLQLLHAGIHVNPGHFQDFTCQMTAVAYRYKGKEAAFRSMPIG